jgi:chemotaxis protein CheX
MKIAHAWTVNLKEALMKTDDKISKWTDMFVEGMNMSVSKTIPLPFVFSYSISSQQSLQVDFGVMVGLIGDIEGDFFLLGKEKLFSSLGETMFGMPLEGEMLKSFVGELANMISGNLCTEMSRNLKLDITHPTVLSDESCEWLHDGIEVIIQFTNEEMLKVVLLPHSRTEQTDFSLH